MSDGALGGDAALNKISVVIPAYNAERTIERTVRNVLGQTLRDIEVWVTDDGSTDRTGAILDGLSNDDSRVHVIHQQNCGAYQARLNALKQIKAPYFGFVDADDTIEPEMYEKMLAVMERENLDAVQCGYSTSEEVRVCGNEGLRVVSGDELMKYKFNYLVNPRVSCFIWDKLYRNQYDFEAFEPTDKVTNFDDMIFNLQFFLPVKRMGFVCEPLYHYAETAGSAVHSFSDKKVKDFREAWRIRKAMLPKYGLSADCAENHQWLRRNRLNCVKAIVKAGNLGACEKVKLIYELLRVR